MKESTTTNQKKLNKSLLIQILIVTVLTILFRTYKVNTPLVEYHSWRQADTLAVARNLTRNGFDLLHPKYDDISKLQSGLENPNGYRMVEFPLYNALVALVSMAFSFLPIEQVGRWVNILFSVISAIAIFEILRKSKGLISAWIATVIFAVFPFFVFYTRAALPETLAITFILTSTWISSNNTKNYFLKVTVSFILFGLAVLVKPTAIFYGLVPFGLLALDKPFKRSKSASLIVATIVSLVPLAIWRMYIQNFPEGIPSSEWLFTYINTQRGLEPIFFKPAFFRWIFFERINLIILGSYSFAIASMGLLSGTKKHVHYLMALASAIYLFTFQGGNVQHEYYQVLILPTLAILVGVGSEHIIKSQKNIYVSWLAGLVITLLLMASWLASYDKVRHYYYSLSDIPQFAKIVRDLTDPNDKIVVDTQGDTTALFAFDRKGSPAMIGNPDELRQLGYSYVFTYAQETAQNLITNDKLKIVFRNNRFALLKL